MNSTTCFPLETPTEVAWQLSGQLHENEPVRNIRIDSSPFLVGRRKDSALTIPCPTVSGRHAELIVREGELYVRDLQSSNGTFINGERINDEFRVGAGDLVQFARTVFRVTVASSNRQTQTVDNEDAADRALALIQFDKLVTDRAVVPHYQAIVKTDTRDVIGYEVLSRSRLFGLRTPDAMFSAAAVLDLEAELSRILRYEGVKAADIPGDPLLFVNTHPAELLEPALLEFSIRELIQMAPPDRLVLEIHEKSVTCVSQMRDLQEALCDLGVKLAYDDFGAGQARLLELVEVPPDYLKFDIGLVRDIDTASSSRQKMLATLVGTARELDVATLAEGVETEGELQVCTDVGFDYIQGFVFSKPAVARAHRDGQLIDSDSMMATADGESTAALPASALSDDDDDAP